MLASFDPFDFDNLPKGIWYEKTRNRWRIRLYHGDDKRFLEYVPAATPELVQIIYNRALAWRQKQQDLDAEIAAHTKPNSVSPQGLLASLRQRRIAKAEDAVEDGPQLRLF